MSLPTKKEPSGVGAHGGVQSNPELRGGTVGLLHGQVKQSGDPEHTPQQSLYSAARKLVAAGFSVLPVNDDKRPNLRTWKEYQSRIPNAEELESWFLNSDSFGVAVVCGRVSEHLEVIDLDAKNDTSGTLNKAAEAAIRELAPGLWERLVIEKSRSGGLHLYFRSPSPEGNSKLAHCPNVDGKPSVIAETRGEGGYVVCAPTPGYVVIQGSLDSPPVLTVEEREDLLAAVRTLDRTPEKVSHPSPVPAKRTDSKTPLDDFNERGDALEVLLRHGWKVGNELPDGRRYLRRPGKTDKGWSASWNHKGRGTMTVFSSNAEPFETAPTSYSPAAIYTLLECDGDFSRAAAELREKGYGKTEVAPDLRERLLARRFNHASAPPKPAPRFKISGKTVCTAGNLTSISAQAKVGKSAFVGAAISAMICAESGKSDRDNLGLAAVAPEGRHLLHFDTEQSPYDADRLVRTALRRAGVEVPPDFIASFGLAGFSAPDLQASLEMQMEDLAQSGGNYAVIIDGVADLVTDVNDPAECNELIARLHALAITYDCSIICVVHENPAQDSGKMRGHLGSQLERKCESNLRLQRTKEKEITLVSGDKMRGAPITENEGPRFRWSLIEDMHVSIETKAKTKESEKRERLESLAEDAFNSSGKDSLRYTDLVGRLRDGSKFSQSTAEDYVRQMRALKVVFKIPETGTLILNPI